MTADGSRNASRTRRVPLVLALTTVGVVVLVGLVGAFEGTPRTAERPAATPARDRSATSSPTTTASCSPRSIRSLTAALFDWNTTDTSRHDVVQRVANWADPTGRETPGLLLDLGEYLPSEDAWQQLAQYRTRQRASVASIAIPSTWPRAAAAGHSRLSPTTSAFTLEVTRFRTGIVAGSPVSATGRTTFTMFVRCSHNERSGRLLRLSLPGRPLP